MATSSTPSTARHGALADTVASVLDTGVGVIPGAFDPATIAWARHLVLDHTATMKNTRPTESSRHLAGFHRFPALEPLHTMITANEVVAGHIAALTGTPLRTIGLTDITINRSQQWHKDLLRGEFSRHLDAHTCADHHGKVFKVIVYLQDATSLQYVRGSHRHDIPLTSDAAAIPGDTAGVERVETTAGDAVIIDICTTHRGSGEDAFATASAVAPPRILVSTVFGRTGCDFTDRMERGNADRQAAWERRHI